MDKLTEITLTSIISMSTILHILRTEVREGWDWARFNGRGAVEYVI